MKIKELKKIKLGNKLIRYKIIEKMISDILYNICKYTYSL